MKSISLPPVAAAAMIVNRLQALADRDRARQVQKYFKEAVRALGIPSPALRSLAREIHDATKKSWTVREAVALCEKLLPRPELEIKSMATLVLLRHQKQFSPTLFGRIHRWLAADYLNNWASVDIFCPEALGILLSRYPALLPRMESWARHPSRWVRRASIVAFLKLVKKEEFREPAYAMAARHFSSRDDLLQKAAGWLLREAGKQDMARLERFLLAHGPAVPRTTLRYAIERFPEEKRKRLLEATRPKKPASTR